MYNRYVPQPDGTFRRNQVDEPKREPTQPRQRQQPSPPQPEPPKQEEPPRKQPLPNMHINRSPSSPPRQRRHTEPESLGIGNFLRQLLPGDFNTEDLLVVILLLLMSQDCAEDQNFAIMTLAIYLFL